MTVKNVVIFGATGQIGLKTCAEAINKGLNVRAVSRDPSQYPEDLKAKIEILKGDVTNKEDVKNAIEGQDAVIVTLGTRNKLEPTTALSDGLQNIVDAMKSQDIKLLSVCLSAFLFYPPDKVPAVFHAVNAEHQRMFDVLKASELNWIAVNPPHFTDDTSTKYSVKHDGLPGARSISKTALASFMIDSLSQPEHYQKVCGISQDDN